MLPTGKLLEESLQLGQPMFRIVETPIREQYVNKDGGFGAIKKKKTEQVTGGIGMMQHLMNG